jgi:hypothetical protein
MGFGNGASTSSQINSHCFTPGTDSHSNAGKRPSPPAMYSGENVAGLSPQSGDVILMVGSGYEANWGPLTNVLASRPLALAKSQLAVTSTYLSIFNF